MIVYQEGPVTLHHDDCLVALRGMADESVHAVVTDPPYGLANTDPAHVVEALTKWATGDREFIPEGRGFMGKAWDAFVPPPAVWDECLRVLKPGGHLLAFAGSRTFDLMTLSIRFAGFDIRDSIAWLYGSGFPKSLDVGKAIDKAAGVEREVVGERKKLQSYGDQAGNAVYGSGPDKGGVQKITAPATEAARLWDGWGTALKPAFEPIVVARKPFPGTVAANVLAHGTGALNIDATRIPGTKPDTTRGGNQLGTMNDDGWQPKQTGERIVDDGKGRWPANVILDESQAAELDRQAPSTGASASVRGTEQSAASNGTVTGERARVPGAFHGDVGGASRFFYVAKAPTSERPEVEGTMHATVKPLDLMQRLIRLVTPPGGTVVDPFAGSGTTLEAAVREGFDVIGVEREAEYLPLILKRVQKDHAQSLFGDDL